MHAVIFEVWPAKGCREAYLEIAAKLRKELIKVPGFISVERFESLTESGKMLSLSFWESEAAIKNWREQTPHRQAQKSGRELMFANYRLRVAEVNRDYGKKEREQAPGND